MTGGALTEAAERAVWFLDPRADFSALRPTLSAFADAETDARPVGRGEFHQVARVFNSTGLR